MNKINNKRIFLNLGILVVFVFALLAITTNAHAEGGYNYNYDTFDGYNSQHYTRPVYTPVYTPAPTPVYVPAPTPVYVAPAPTTTTVYSSSTNPYPAPRAVAKKTTTTKATTTTEPVNSDLAANAVFGEGSFLPNGLIQWVLFGLLVLLIVILARKIYGGREKYHATPLKHD